MLVEKKSLSLFLSNFYILSTKCFDVAKCNILGTAGNYFCKDILGVQ